MGPLDVKKAPLPSLASYLSGTRAFNVDQKPRMWKRLPGIRPMTEVESQNVQAVLGLRVRSKYAVLSEIFPRGSEPAQQHTHQIIGGGIINSGFPNT